MFEVMLSRQASDFYSEARDPLARKLNRCFEALESDSRLGKNIKSLKGDFDGYLRYRVGEYRVVYRIDDEASQVFVALIAHRRDVYE